MSRGSATGLGPRLCERWMRCYLHRLPGDVAAQRQAEISSDLWEQSCDAERSSQSRARYNMSVIGRVFSGLFADLAWRRGILRSQPDAPTVFERFSGASQNLVFVLGAIGLAPSFMILQLLVTQRLSSFQVLWILGAVALSTLLVIGLVLRGRETRPALSTVLLVLGSPAPSIAVFWLPPVYLLSVAIAATAIVSAPRRSVRDSLPV